PTPEEPLHWTDLDRRAVDTVRVLAMDAVERAGSGHPGTAMSLAPAAYLLFQRVLRHDPADPNWPGRDRFVLSAGHSSLTLYIQLYLSGYGLELADLKALRQWGSRTPGHPEYGHAPGGETTTGPLSQGLANAVGVAMGARREREAVRRWGSRTPGHPEYGHTPGVGTTTGPLGQGLANAVGMAMAARRERGLFAPDAPPGTSPFDHHVYVIASDGDIEEGISHEASARAGHPQLGHLIAIYDDNRISIEDDTRVAMSEDVPARYRAYGWHVQTVDWRRDDGYQEDVEALWRALLAARAETARPSFIALRTVIGWPAPRLQNTGKIHGSPLGADEVARTKRLLGFDPEGSFVVEDEVLHHARRALDRGKRLRTAWQDRKSTRLNS